jgi:hypothetical protein
MGIVVISRWVIKALRISQKKGNIITQDIRINIAVLVIRLVLVRIFLPCPYDLLS